MKKELAKGFIPKQYILEQYKKRDKNNKMIIMILVCISIIMFPNTISILLSMNNHKQQVNNNNMQVKIKSYDLNDIVSICNDKIDGQFNLNENILFVNEKEIKNICNKTSISIKKIDYISDDKYKIRISFEE